MRAWKPLTKAKLAAILADTEQDCPAGNYSADEVYRLAREVEMRRVSSRMFTAAIAAVGQWLRKYEDRPAVTRNQREELRALLSNILAG